MRIGVPERQTHDYIRHDTTTLFAALEIATGRVEQACLPRHRHHELQQLLGRAVQQQLVAEAALTSGSR